MSFSAVNHTGDPQWRVSGGEPPEGELQASFINVHTGDEVEANDGFGIPTSAYTIASGENIDIGDLVRLDGAADTDDLTELTAITQTVLGVATEAVVAGAATSVVTLKAVVVRASKTDPDSGLVRKTRFATTDVNSVVPVASTHVGLQVALDLTSEEWTIDVSDEANTDVEIVGVDLTRGTYIVVFLDAVIQTPTTS